MPTPQTTTQSRGQACASLPNGRSLHTGTAPRLGSRESWRPAGRLSTFSGTALIHAWIQDRMVAKTSPCNPSCQQTGTPPKLEPHLNRTGENATAHLNFAGSGVAASRWLAGSAQSDPRARHRRGASPRANPQPVEKPVRRVVTHTPVVPSNRTDVTFAADDAAADEPVHRGDVDGDDAGGFGAGDGVGVWNGLDAMRLSRQPARHNSRFHQSVGSEANARKSGVGTCEDAVVAVLRRARQRRSTPTLLRRRSD